MKKVIVLGNDHTNSLGIIQSLGKEGYYLIAFVWGVKTDMLRSSRYLKEIHSGNNIDACITKILKYNNGENEIIPIIACCDAAALALERNADKLRERFVFEHATNYTLAHLAKKENQVNYALRAGFNVPKTWNLNENKSIPSDIVYPCLIKPLVSCEGAKTDIRVCRCEDELKNNLNSLKYTKQVILQQYIERDYEISILGCGTKSGGVIIPCVENKLTLYPKNVGLECLANMQPLKDITIIDCIKTMVQNIGYVGTFSVEMMHCKLDGKFYFTEINLRNDGANAFVYKYGVNLPLNHIEDLTGKPLTQFNDFHPGFYIWDMHHFLSLVHREIGIIQWIKELRVSKGFLTYFSDDKKPFFKQYTNWILLKLHLKKNEQY